MSQEPGHHEGLDETDEEYPLGAPEPTPADYRPDVYPRYGPRDDEDAAAGERFQFTLRELLGLVGGLAIVLAVLGCIPGGYSPEVIAGVAGVGLLASLVMLAVVQPRPILRVAWWVLLAFYLLASVVAVISSAL